MNVDKWISDEAYTLRLRVFKLMGESIKNIGDTPMADLYPVLALNGLNFIASMADSLFCIALEAHQLNKTMGRVANKLDGMTSHVGENELDALRTLTYTRADEG